jgi:hypothetical protein
VDNKPIEAAEKVLEGFKGIIALTEQARLEEVSAYDVVAGGLIRIGIDLNDSRIASNLAPTGQLVEALLPDLQADGMNWSTDHFPPALTLYGRRGGKIILSLPAVLADLEQAFQNGYLHDMLSPELAEKAGVLR